MFKSFYITGLFPPDNLICTKFSKHFIKILVAYTYGISIYRYIAFTIWI